MKPPGVIEAHRSLCSLCAHKAHDPCAQCDHSTWSFYDCTEAAVPVFPQADLALRRGGVLPQPGDLLALAIRKITGQTAGNCACSQRQQQMNQGGWIWCFRNRKIIVGWLCQEAAARGHPVTPTSAMSLFRAAFKELRA